MNKKKFLVIGIILFISIFLIVVLSKNSNDKTLVIDKEKYTQIYLYDLGKSKIEIIIKNDFVFLINTGLEEERDNLLDYLDQLGIEEIDYLILTNRDDKYIGNVTYLLEHFKIDYLYLNDYNYQSKYIDDLFIFLEDAYTEEIILTSNENIKIDSLKIDIYPYMENEFTMEDKSLLINIKEGDSSIYLTNNISNKRIDEINNSTLLVTENKSILDVKADYYLYDGNQKIKKDNMLERNKEIYINEEELIIK